MPVRAVTADDLKCRFGCCRRVILEIKTELLQASKQGLGLQHGRELILKYFLAGWITQGGISVGFIHMDTQRSWNKSSSLVSLLCPRARSPTPTGRIEYYNINALLSLGSPQRAKRCTRDRCCPSHPSPWRSAFWGPRVWPSTAAASKESYTHVPMKI